jgi:hypothetical protein
LPVFLFLPTLWGQSSTAGYLTAGEAPKVAGKRNDAVQAKIPVRIQPGFHVNSNTPSEDYLIPLKVTWTETGALQGGEVAYPKPSLEKYEFSPKPLSVFTGNFDLIARFKVAPNAQAGPGMAVGKLRYQACNNKACFPPKTIEVRVPYQIQ